MGRGTSLTAPSLLQRACSGLSACSINTIGSTPDEDEKAMMLSLLPTLLRRASSSKAFLAAAKLGNDKEGPTTKTGDQKPAATTTTTDDKVPATIRAAPIMAPFGTKVSTSGNDSRKRKSLIDDDDDDDDCETQDNHNARISNFMRMPTHTVSTGTTEGRDLAFPPVTTKKTARAVSEATTHSVTKKQQRQKSTPLKTNKTNKTKNNKKRKAPESDAKADQPMSSSFVETVGDGSKAASPMPSENMLQPLDVVCGRGEKLCRTHPGNLAFRRVIDAHREEYKSALHRDNKTSLVRKIIGLIESTGGRFMKKAKTGSTSAAAEWVQVDDRAAREKVGYAIRNEPPMGPSEQVAAKQRKKRRRISEEQAAKVSKHQQELYATQQRIFREFMNHSAHLVLTEPPKDDSDSN